MWKDILKLSPDDRKKFTELGEEHAPEDMEEFNLNRNMSQDSFQDYKDGIKKNTEKHKKLKNKIDSMKDKIDPDDYMLMQSYLNLMKYNVENSTFNTYLTALKLISREYPIFLRGR